MPRASALGQPDWLSRVQPTVFPRLLQAHGHTSTARTPPQFGGPHRLHPRSDDQPDEANQLWPNQDPIGKRLISLKDEQVRPSWTRNRLDRRRCRERYTARQPRQRTSMEIYLPMTSPKEKPVMNILLRSSLPAAELADSLRGLVAQLNPTAPSPRCAPFRAWSFHPPPRRGPSAYFSPHSHPGIAGRFHWRL